MRVSYLKCCLLVPFLAIISGLIFLLFLYWYIPLRKKFFYNLCPFKEATHLYIIGFGKYSDCFI